MRTGTQRFGVLDIPASLRGVVRNEFGNWPAPFSFPSWPRDTDAVWKSVLPGLAAAAAAGAVALAQVPIYKTTLAADQPAIRALAPAGDAVTRLVAALDRGAVTLRPQAGDDHLAAVLAALDVPVDSQLLVFSKTSVQAAHITPSRPRALYFNDEVMVGHVPGTPGLEVMAVDPARGPVFYAVGRRGDGAPAFTASTTCLRCHHGPNTMGVPGPFVGSVIPGPGGAPLRDDTAIITDHTTPFWERWGGWYVTARRGEPRSRANAVASSPNARDALVREVPSNVTALHHFLDPRAYLAPTSDIVALMVLEHQTQGTNLLTRVAWQARLAGTSAPGPGRSLDDDLDALADYLLFTGEAPLAAPVTGMSSFAASFSGRGPRDGRGRSLRQFDLQTRLFRYPLSYLIHGRQFAALPREVRHAVLNRLGAILRAEVPAARQPHLTADVRRAVAEIVRDTVPDLPAGW